MSSLSLRRANGDDKRQLFGWRNDPWIVSLSASRREVTWEEHSAWFDRVVKDDGHLFFIIEVSGEEAGIARFDRSADHTAVMNIYLLQPFTGRGHGVDAIREASLLCFKHWPGIERIEAQVRKDNKPSQSAFSKSNFHLSDKLDQRDDDADLIWMVFSNPTET